MVELQFPPSVWILLVSATSSAAIAYLVWRQRPGKGIVAFAGLMISITFWALGNFFEQVFVEFDHKFIFSRTNYVWISLVPAMWLLFVSEYAEQNKWITPRNVRLLAIHPILVQVAIWTNPLHDLFWIQVNYTDETGYWLVNSDAGPLFWVHAFYAYVLIMIGTVILVRSLIRAPELYRGQMITMLIGIAAPWVSNVIYLTRIIPLRGIDPTPLAFTFTGAAAAWSLYRYRLFDMLPIARDTIVESMNDMVFVLDDQDRFIDINPAAKHLFKVDDQSSVIGRPLGKILPEYEAVFDQLRGMTDHTSEFLFDVDGELRYFEGRITPLRDRHDNPVGRLFMLAETTERKKAEIQINAQYIALMQANDELKRARAQAEEGSRLKSEFLATISHELRTPLNSIIGYTDLLLTGLPGELNEKQIDYVKRTLSNGERLLTLINELLDISKIESGRFELFPQPFDVRNLINDVQVRTQSLADKKQLTFNVAVDPALPETLFADAKRIEQIVVNLVGNAIKYTETGQVDLVVKPKAGDHWVIAVTDTGVGIPPHAIEYIFDEFRQVDGSTRREYQGTGLGLTIVRRLTQMMDGTVEIESEVGTGSTFTVTLPLVRPDDMTVDETAPQIETAG